MKNIKKVLGILTVLIFGMTVIGCGNPNIIVLINDTEFVFEWNLVLHWDRNNNTEHRNGTLQPGASVTTSGGSDLSGLQYSVSIRRRPQDVFGPLWSNNWGGSLGAGGGGQTIELRFSDATWF